MPKKVSIPYQLIIRSDDRLNRASTNPNDFQIYINEFLPNDTNLFKVKLIQCAISKKALTADVTNNNRLNANYIEVNAYFNGSYGYDTLYQGCNRYVHFIPPYESQAYVDVFSAPSIICNKFDQNYLTIQVYGYYFTSQVAGTRPTRSLLTHVDGTAIFNTMLIFEITPIYDDIQEN